MGEEKITKELVSELVKGKNFKWRCGGVGWPEKQPGSVCIVGSAYDGFYLIAESGGNDLKALCRNVLEFDCRFSPDFWYADKSNDTALRILTELNEEVKTVLAGKQYEAWNAPWHRRYISTSQSPVFEMSNGLDYILTTLNDLLDEKNPKLFLPKDSKALEQLRPVKQLGKRDEGLTFADMPAVVALGVAVIELKGLCDNERRQKGMPAKNQDYDRLRIGIYDPLEKYREGF